METPDSPLPQPGWYPDPQGLVPDQYRYWNGSEWTGNVSNPEQSGYSKPQADFPTPQPIGHQGQTSQPAQSLSPVVPTPEPEPSSQEDPITPVESHAVELPQSPEYQKVENQQISQSFYQNETTPLAGWYPDPRDQTQHRYWDGQQWTEHTHNPQQPPTAYQAQHQNPDPYVLSQYGSQPSQPAYTQVPGTPQMGYAQQPAAPQWHGQGMQPYSQQTVVQQRPIQDLLSSVEKKAKFAVPALIAVGGLYLLMDLLGFFQKLWTYSIYTRLSDSVGGDYIASHLSLYTIINNSR